MEAIFPLDPLGFWALPKGSLARELFSCGVGGRGERGVVGAREQLPLVLSLRAFSKGARKRVYFPLAPMTISLVAFGKGTTDGGKGFSLGLRLQVGAPSNPTRHTCMEIRRTQAKDFGGENIQVVNHNV